MGFDPIFWAFAQNGSSGDESGGGDDWYITDARDLFIDGARLDAMEPLLAKVKNPVSMAYMFYGCNKLTKVDLSSIDTSKAAYMPAMFQSCKKLEEIIGFSATCMPGITIGFPSGSSSSSQYALKRLTFRTDLADGVYSIRSAINIKYCSFERDGMVEMFNTLPDVSGLGLSSSYTTITITGNPCVTDGSLTEEDEAIATAKGWTLVK